MKKFKQLLLCAAITFAAIPLQAAFVAKAKEIPKSEQSVTTANASIAEPADVTQQERTKFKKKSLIKNIFKKGEEKNGISKELYIILSIFSLGWLAMGIIDDFKGSNWITALLVTLGGFMAAGLLILFIPFLPLLLSFAGIVWAFLKMKDYFK
jgi:hypothetical protein